MYIHNHSQWPHFVWDHESLLDSLAAVRHKQGKHLGTIEALGFDLRVEAGLSTLTAEVVNTSAIEGSKLPPDEVRSSISRHLGIDVSGLPRPSQAVEGVVEMMIDATTRFQEPISTERIFGWHCTLFPTGRSGMHRIAVGAWRRDEDGPMQVVSGPLGNERTHFQAPSAHRLEREVQQFIDWFEAPTTIDPVLRAAIAHFWFVTLHPFDDGNGRIARAIAEMALSRADNTGQRYYSMSSAIEARRRDYYLALESAQRGSLNITAWLVWFLRCLDASIEDAQTALQSVLHKARIWQRINTTPINARQTKVINRLLDNFVGHLSTSKYAKLAKCSNDTALRDIRELVQRGILIKNPAGGRSTSYRLMSLHEILD